MNELLELALRAAREAGDAIMKIYDDPNSDFGIERKADNSPLTIADKRSNEVIMSYLAGTGIPVLSEEGRSIAYEERAAWPTLWVVDPLDGTKEFIKRNGEFTVNIALVKGGEPVLGVIYLPVKDVMYYGTLEGGAFRQEIDGTVKLPQPKGSDEPYRIVASRSHMSDETRDFIARLEKTHGKAELVSRGSSIKICMVAEGSADIYPRFAPTMEWDTAAGHAIARAAGKQIYQTDNVTPLRYNKEDLLNPYFIVR